MEDNTGPRTETSEETFSRFVDFTYEPIQGTKPGVLTNWKVGLGRIWGDQSLFAISGDPTFHSNFRTELFHALTHGGTRNMTGQFIRLYNQQNPDIKLSASPPGTLTNKVLKAIQGWK